MRLLVTGGRDWTDENRVHYYLMSTGPALVVHGGARGLDAIVDRLVRRWSEFGDPDGREWPAPEVHPVRPSDWRTIGKGAGSLRNQLMVDRGADRCAAFPTKESRGTYDCAARATIAGIPVTWLLGSGVSQVRVDAEVISRVRSLR